MRERLRQTNRDRGGMEVCHVNEAKPDVPNMLMTQTDVACMRHTNTQMHTHTHF